MSKRILLADDEFEIRDICRSILEDAGYQIAEASDGKNAMEMIEKEKYDLYLLDMMMPHFTGLEITKAIKKKYPLAIIIIFTGFSTIDGAIEAVYAGAYKYLAKPIEPRELLKQVKKGLNYAKELYGFDKKINTNVLEKSETEEFNLLKDFTPDEKEEFLKLGKKVVLRTDEESPNLDNSLRLIQKGEVLFTLNNSSVDHLDAGDSFGAETIVFNHATEGKFRLKSDAIIIEIKNDDLVNFFSDKDQLFSKYKENLIIEGYQKWRKAIQRILLLKMVSED